MAANRKLSEEQRNKTKEKKIRKILEMNSKGKARQGTESQTRYHQQKPQKKALQQSHVSITPADAVKSATIPFQPAQNCDDDDATAYLFCSPVAQTSKTAATP